jgi:crotonobetainyl-CoA:carnitine CoA-transferase CaiB-like acyl-CoA transferase
LIKDERFLENRVRGKNHEELDQIIGDWVRQHTVDEAMQILVAHEAAAAPIYSVADILTDPQFIARKTIVEIEDQDIGSLKMQAPTPRLSRSPGKIEFTGPHLGQHNLEVYVGLLPSAQKFEALKSEGVI